MSQTRCGARFRNNKSNPRERLDMNILLWVLQILTALMYGASGVMKVFLFEKISADVPSFGAMSRGAWKAFGVLELICAVGLILPDALHWLPVLTVVAAALLTLESLVFVRVHSKYDETAPIVLKRRAGSGDGVHHVRPAGPASGRLSGRPRSGEVRGRCGQGTLPPQVSLFWA